MFKFENGNICVKNFFWLNSVLKLAGDQKSAELRKALEMNWDELLQKVLNHDCTSLMTFKDVLKLANGDESRIAYMMKIADAHGSVLYSACKSMTSISPLSINAINSELEMLKQFVGIEEDCILTSIDWESGHAYRNGLRAPPWRQTEGDLGYIFVKPADGNDFVVLGNKEGYWRINGPTEDGTMDYTQVGDKYCTLCALLKQASATFATNIDGKSFSFKKASKRGVKVGSSEGSHTAAVISSGASKNGKAAGSRKNFKKASNPRWSDPNTAITSHSAGGSAAEATISVDSGSSKPKSNRGAGSALSALQATENEEEESEEEEEEELDDRRSRTTAADFPPEHWVIQKLVKYLSHGNQTATIIALCSLRDYDLTSEACQFAIREHKGLDVLINLLDTDDVRCKIGALQVLRDISESFAIKHAIADLDGVKAMVAILDDQNEELKSLAAATIANCAKYSRNRTRVRQLGGIPKLVKLLQGEDETEQSIEMARCGALALWSCSKSKRIQRMIMKAGALPLLAKHMDSENVPLLIPFVGILEECAATEEYRVKIVSMVPLFVRHMTSDSVELTAYAAGAIFKCAQDDETCKMVGDHDGLEPLVKAIQNPGNKTLLLGATGAIWKCAMNPGCNAKLAAAKAVEFLCPLLVNQTEDVLIHVTGALSELARGNELARKAIRSSGGIENLVKLLTGTNEVLLINVTKAVGSCAADKDTMAAINRQDGVRLLWSLLKSPNPEVQAGAAWAICPCIEMAPDAGELVRSFVGGLELIVGLLKSKHIEVLASVCAAVANIAKDEENLGVITDHGVVPMLGRLARTTDDRLRRHLAFAIAQCCSWPGNRAGFGHADAVAPLVKYLKSEDSMVHRATALALRQLSCDAENCITMHEAGVVQLLIEMIGSTDEILQEASASCIYNIRKLALCNELFKHT